MWKDHSVLRFAPPLPSDWLRRLSSRRKKWACSFIVVVESKSNRNNCNRPYRGRRLQQHWAAAIGYSVDDKVINHDGPIGLRRPMWLIWRYGRRQHAVYRLHVYSCKCLTRNDTAAAIDVDKSVRANTKLYLCQNINVVCVLTLLFRHSCPDVTDLYMTPDGRPINRLQNGVILLIFKYENSNTGFVWRI